MDVIQLGPLILNLQLLLFILSAFAAYMAMNYRLSKVEVRADRSSKVRSNKYAVALILGVFIWKFSILLFDPIMTLKYPLSLLYFNGGDKGILLAVAISLGYIWVRSRVDGTTIMMNMDVLSTGWIAGSSLYHLMLIITQRTDVLFHALFICLSAILAFFLFDKKKAVGNAVLFNQIVIWYCLGSIAVSFVKEERVSVVLGFTREQLGFLILFLIFLLIDLYKVKEKRRLSNE
ncbi:MAG: hypothetical protein P0Y55_05435 [Candidatus Cohnella colombiensis]|uniref:Uncharacterized protein n=1 Tax=Candidatus Cohnella colombiensis TaxID=3121368 RepID=A0AA95EXX7_9BACL|nr:MAG: hypothetical protein P0Y55_05435 [Cohnella sp.]